MKQKTKPTRAQRKLMASWGLIPGNWFVERDTPREMVIVHRLSDKTRTIPKESEDFETGEEE